MGKDASEQSIHWADLPKELFQSDDSAPKVLGKNSSNWSRDADWKIIDGFNNHPNTFLPKTLGFCSSGTTGAAKTYWRNREQILAEAKMIDNLLGRLSGVEIVSFAPVVHIFGFACGLVLAGLTESKFSFKTHLSSSGLLPVYKGRQKIILTLPATWYLLEQSGVLNSLLADPKITILHSTGPIPAKYRRLFLDEQFNTSVVEIFGSAETGGIGFRINAADNDDTWKVFDDVSIWPAAKTETGAFVSSPRCAFREHYIGNVELREDLVVKISDRLKIISETQFRFLGRQENHVKVNGTNVYLDILCDKLSERFTEIKFVAKPVHESLRGESFNLFLCLTAPYGQSELRILSKIRTEIKRLLGPHIYPNNIEFVSSLQLTETGKPIIY